MKNTYILLLALFSFIAIQAQVDRTVMPTPGPAPEVNLGTPQSFKLNNGLKVLVVENHKLPRVSIQLSIDNPPILHISCHEFYFLTLFYFTVNYFEISFNSPKSIINRIKNHGL